MKILDDNYILIFKDDLQLPDDFRLPQTFIKKFMMAIKMEPIVVAFGEGYPEPIFVEIFQ